MPKKADKNGQETALTTFTPAATLSQVLDNFGAQLTPIGMKLPHDLQIGECQQIMGSIHDFKATFEGAYLWAVGDLVGYSQDKFGNDKYTEVASKIEMDYNIMRNCMWVSRAIPVTHRVVGASWNHHRLVAPDAFSLDEKANLLQEAVDNGLSVAAFRVFLEKYKGVKEAVAEPPPQATEEVSAPPPPQQITVTSFQAVAKWVQNATAQAEIEWCVLELVKRANGLGFFGKLQLEIEARTMKLGADLGLAGMPSAAPTYDDVSIKASALKAVEDYEASGKQYDPDGVLLEFTEAKSDPADDDEEDMPFGDEGNEVKSEVQYVDLDESNDIITPGHPWEI